MFEDLKDALGEKTLYWLIGGGAVLFVLALLFKKGNIESDEVLVTPTAYSSYPDAVTNANTIIDSINQFSEYTGDRVIASTSGFMESGFADLRESIDTGYNQLDESILSLGNTLGGVASDVTEIKTNVSTLKGNTYSIRPSSKPASSTTPSASTTPKTETYSKTNYTGVSIVDGLKSVGVYHLDGKNVGDYTSRIALAEANGITNYTGTPEQNTQLLNKLKSGTLVKPS